VGDVACAVLAATCFIDNRITFLHKIRTIAESFDTHIICFNADMLAGKRHARTALHHAVRSFHNRSMVSNTLEMEALLFAAGSRQCSVAASFGVHEGDNSLLVCCYPTRDGIWDALTPLMDNADQDWDIIGPRKRAYLMELFGITEDEIASCSGDHITELVLERIALLEVYR
jgi:KEOPS complex subunit Cgi121